MSEDGRQLPRQVWHFALLVAALFAMLGSQLLGERPLLYGVINAVAPAGVAPRDIVPDPGSEWSVIVHRSDWKAPVAAMLGHTRPGRPVRLAWVVRQWSVLSMPLAAWRQGEVAVMTEDGYGYRLTGLLPDQQRALAARGAIGWFPWWRYLWGWLPVAAFVAFVWAELRWQDRRRALLGIM